MKRNSGIILTLCLGLFLTAPLMSDQPKVPPDAQTFSGEIMDAFCAKAGSHEKRMAEINNMGHDKNSWATMCARLGSKYVLYDSSKKAIYSLDDQDKAEAFAGQTVRVQGSRQKNKIKVQSIEAFGAQAQGRP